MKQGISGAEQFQSATPRSQPVQRNVETARAILDGLSRGEWDILRTHLAPGGSTWVLGFTPERLAKHVRSPNFIAETFPNGVSFEIKAVVAEGNRVVVEWDDEADTSTGKHYENNGVSIFTFDEEGRLASYHEYIDPERFFAVL
ncbi:hypothetical protein EDM76_03720 [bacterium]|nr:MAG: hypothetical protein EDM76_03720 [bacterium]